jgi:N-acyl homoserine lactone hydrolase
MPKMDTMNRSVWLLSLSCVGCSVTSATTRPAELGPVVSMEVMEASLAAPGPIRLEKVVAADWAVERGGLINLDHPEAEGLEDGEEPIQIYLYVLHHPERGAFFVDSGVEQALVDGDADDSALSSLVASVMGMEKLVVHRDTRAWIADNGAPAGVFLTHLHIDHIMGLPDVPDGTPVYVGPGEHEASMFSYMFVQGTTDRALDGLDLRELEVAPRAVVDVFGDGSLFAIHVPGHTPGSLAFVARTTEGPALIVGDTSHTAWGWDHGVEPGSFTADHEANAESLNALIALAKRHPGMAVHLGHQVAESVAVAR